MKLLERNPCKPDCKKRSATCHANCPEYAEFRRELDEDRNKRRLDHTARYIIDRGNRIRRIKYAKNRT
jgi:hypothetical protein